MRLLIKIFICLFIPFGLSAQGEGNIWYFGNNAGIDFNGDEPVAISDGAMLSHEGCASISDSLGQILFYSEGTKVWNANHELMPNGTGLLGGFSSTQAAIIVKKPGENTLYYLFTTGNQADSNGLSYSEIDMSLDGGMGDVNENKNILVVSPVCEKVTSIRHENNEDFWIITHIFGSNAFHSYLLTSSGLDLNPVISNIGSDVSYEGPSNSASGSTGYLKSSQDGSRIAIANPYVNVEVFDFDKTNGTLSNVITFDSLGTEHSVDYQHTRVYGLEFSPNSNLLYVGHKLSTAVIDTLYYLQLNLQDGSSEEIYNSRYLIGTGDGIGAMQIGPDQKIYIATNNNSLHRIENPNELGSNCNFVEYGFSLGAMSVNFGLPNFHNAIYINYNFDYLGNCLGELTQFSFLNPTVDSVLWDFGDPMSGINNESNQFSPAHLFTDLGMYTITLTMYTGIYSELISKGIYIQSFPDVYIGNDSSLCEGGYTLLDASTTNASYQWQDFSVNPEYLVTQPGVYWVDVNVNNCITRDSIYFDVCPPYLEMPNIFSPNSNGVNDLFKPFKHGDIVQYSINIYNRWGSLVYSGERIEDSWNGKKDGDECTEGVYFWIAKYSNASGRIYESKGSVALVR